MMKSSEILRCLLVSFSLLTFVVGLKVCSTFEAYYEPLSTKCFNNPDGEENITQIIQRWGFATEDHYISTKDGYQLFVQRAFTNITKPNPILMVHGYFMSGLGFCLLGNRSIVHVLGDIGYDVWIVNLRGSAYSRGHVNLTDSDREYWNVSYHEMAIYDVREAIDMIYQTTQQKLLYIGYSIGTTTSYIYASMFPSEAEEKLLGVISLAPIAFPGNTKSLIRYIPYLLSLLKYIYSGLGHGEILPVPRLLAQICASFPHLMRLCEALFSPIIGGNFDQIDPLTYPIYLIRGTDSTAVKSVEHWFQNMWSNKFEWFDYGPTKNLELYGQTSPRGYDLSKITVPVALFASFNDYIAAEQDARRVYEALAEDARCGYHVIEDKYFNHLNFINAKDAVSVLYNPIINVLHRMERGYCIKFRNVTK